MSKVNKTLKDLLLSLKAQLFADELPPVDEVPKTFVDAKGKDGKAYRVDKLEVGGIMEVANDAGEFAPVAPGEIVLEDESTVTVGEAGVIESIKPKEDKPAEAKPSDAMPTDAFTRAEFDAIKAESKANSEALATLLSKFALQVASNKAMFSLVEAIANESGEESTEAKKKNAFSNIKTEKELAAAKLKAAFDAAK